MRNSFKLVPIFALTLLTGCTVRLDSVGDAVGKAMATGLACVGNGFVTAAEERLTVTIPSADFEAMRSRLAAMPDNPSIEAAKVLTTEEASLLATALFYATGGPTKLKDVKIDKLLTYPEYEVYLLRTLVHIAKSPPNGPEWSFKRIILKTEGRESGLDKSKIVAGLNINLVGAAPAPASPVVPKTVIYCD